MEVIFVRHAKAYSNVRPRKVGSNARLTFEGMKQPKAVALQLKQFATEGRITSPLPSVIYSSPYIRTRQTAKGIARHLQPSLLSKRAQPEVIIDYRLKEIQKGDWHGMTVADVEPHESAITPEERPYFRPPGELEKADAENWFDVANRMVDFITEREAGGETYLLVVSHNHPIESVIGKLTGLSVYDWDQNPVSNASISRIVKKDGIWQIDDSVYNVTPHIPKTSPFATPIPFRHSPNHLRRRID